MLIAPVLINSMMAIIILIMVAYAVRNIAHPPIDNWIDIDCERERKGIIAHVIDCGLIYPTLYVYLWIGLHYFFIYIVGIAGR